MTILTSLNRISNYGIAKSLASTPLKNRISNLGSNIARLPGDEVVPGFGDVDAVDRVGVPGQKGLHTMV
jgi:hypothetical protein